MADKKNNIPGIEKGREKIISEFNTLKRLGKRNSTKKPGRCPVCRSQSVVSSDIGMRCKKCGYVNKTNRKVNKDLEESKKF